MAPSAQLRPIMNGSMCRTEFQNASAVWPDWMAAVHIGARHVRQRIGGDRPFYIGGDSLERFVEHWCLRVLDVFGLPEEGEPGLRWG